MMCTVCARYCELKNGTMGYCQARAEKGGKIVSTTYGKVARIGLEPVESLSFSSWWNGHSILSMAMSGCCMHCWYCSEYKIARQSLRRPAAERTPQDLVRQACELVPYGNIGIAFGGNEPLVAWEFVRDTCRLAKGRSLKTAVCTNGQASLGVLEKILPYVDAFNVDLKAFSVEQYEKLGGSLEAVQLFIRKAREQSHVEVCVLIVPGFNDSLRQMRKLCRWLAEVDPTLPLILARCHPAYRMTGPETPLETMLKLRKEALCWMNQVSLANV